MTKEDKANEQIEEGIGQLYIGLYNLRRLNKHQEEYDAMGSIIAMLQKDRQFMREQFDIEF